MKKRNIIATSCWVVLAAGLLHSADKPKGEKVEVKAAKELMVRFETTMGNFTVRLFPQDTPKTVENFVGLAKGTKEFVDPKTGAKTKKPFYDGLVFHRVIPDFMIQGGDPLGTGTGGPGYRFEDEFNSPRGFDKPGILAMANAGPGTNGSQFFITVAPTPWLNRRHTIFGEVTEGMDVVLKISDAPKDGSDRPNTPIVMKKVSIIEK